MLDIEHRMEREIVPVARTYSKSLQSGGCRAGSRRSGHFYNAERTDCVVSVASVRCETSHRICQAERLCHRCLSQWGKFKMDCQRCQQRTMHGFWVSPTHLIPVISSKLKFWPCWQF